MYQEAESVLHWVLKINPSVTSGDHLKAMCALAELKALLGLQDDAICLLEAVLQNDPDVRSEHTAFALLRLGRAYTELGDFAEAKRIGVHLHLSAEACAAPPGSVAASVTVVPPTPGLPPVQCGQGIA
jgi:tetratricopeptide (TPR) repeat protein